MSENDLRNDRPPGVNNTLSSMDEIADSIGVLIGTDVAKKDNILYKMKNKIQNTTSMEDKIRILMEEQSKLPETIQNAKDYWCLNSYLNTMAGSAIEQRYGVQGISPKQLSDDALFIEDKYSDDKNYLLFPKDKYVYFSDDKEWDRSYMYIDPSNKTNIIYVDINGHNPLKMVKAQELLTDFNNVILETAITLGHVEHDVFMGFSCSITTDDLGIKIADKPHSSITYKQFVNLRDEIVNIRTIHVDDLLKRGYLSHEAGYQYRLPEYGAAIVK